MFRSGVRGAVAGRFRRGRQGTPPRSARSVCPRRPEAPPIAGCRKQRFVPTSAGVVLCQAGQIHRSSRRIKFQLCHSECQSRSSNLRKTKLTKLELYPTGAGRGLAMPGQDVRRTERRLFPTSPTRAGCSSPHHRRDAPTHRGQLASLGIEEGRSPMESLCTISNPRADRCPVVSRENLALNRHSVGSVGHLPQRRTENPGCCSGSPDCSRCGLPRGRCSDCCSTNHRAPHGHRSQASPCIVPFPGLATSGGGDSMFFGSGDRSARGTRRPLSSRPASSPPRPPATRRDRHYSRTQTGFTG